LTIKESQGRQMWADPKLAALTFLTMGRTDLLQPVSISEALPHLPEAYQAGLVKRSAPSKTIKVVDDYTPHAIAGIFQKYIKKVDTQAQ
jgi:hypothetical protein